MMVARRRDGRREVRVEARIGVSASRPLRMAALNRVMNDVTSDHAAVADPHTHVPGGVPWRVPSYPSPPFSLSLLSSCSV